MRAHARRTPANLALAFALLVALPGSLAPAGADEPGAACGAVLPVAADAALFEGAPRENFGGSPELAAVDPADGPQAWRTLLRFDVAAALPPGAVVDRALLRLWVDRSEGATVARLQLRALSAPWNENEVVWDKAPPASNVLVRHELPGREGELLIDATPLVRTWAARAIEPHGLELRAIDRGALYFAAKEAEDPARPAATLELSCHVEAPIAGDDAEPGDEAQRLALERLRGESLEPVRARFGDGALRHAAFRLPIPAAARRDVMTRARWFLGQYADLLRVPDAGSWQLRRGSSDGRHLVFRQLKDGVPVYAGELIVHLDEEDVIGVAGTYFPDIPARLEPLLTAAEAESIALGLGPEGAERTGDVTLSLVAPALLGSRASSGGTGQEPRLAWLVHTAGPAGLQRAIDARSGALLMEVSGAQDVFDLSIKSHQNRNPPATCVFSPAPVEWFTEAGQVQGTTPDADATTTYTSFVDFDNYLRQSHARDGFTGTGGLYNAIVNINFSPLNAFYSPTCADFSFSGGAGTKDIVGHEVTHGVIDNEADLVYMNQSGALNESIADIFGYFIDPDDWTVGEGSTLGPIRDLVDPRLFNQPDHMLRAQSNDGCGFRDPLNPPTTGPCVLANFDFGFVHTNSGIPNRAASLLIAGGQHGGYSVDRLGGPTVARLMYDAVTNRLTSSSQLADMRDAMVDAAAADPGLTARQRCQVRNAYAAVGLGEGDADCDGVGDSSDADPDADGLTGSADNCPFLFNASQADLDADGTGDACDVDDDNDTVPDRGDNCPREANTDQADADADQVGDRCEDLDRDGVPDWRDNCPTVRNPDQSNLDSGRGDTQGDACDPDDDEDGIPDTSDNCVVVHNPGQQNDDNDFRGNACDNCRTTDNGDQRDSDRDGAGDACDADDDNDGVDDTTDNCRITPNPSQLDSDQDGIGMECDADELGRTYEDRYSFNPERFFYWPMNFGVPVNVGVPICPVCSGGELPRPFIAETTVRFNQPFVAILRDGEGRALESTVGAPSTEHTFRFRPESYSLSRFDYSPLGGDGPPGFGPQADGPGAIPPGFESLPPYVGPAQRRYSIEMYPASEEQLGADAGFSITHLQCEDNDGDGYGNNTAPDCEMLGVPLDCDDSAWDRHAGRGEACDGVDNDCDGTTDEEPLRAAGTSRLVVKPGPAPGETSLRWTELVDVTGYDLLRGLLSKLPGSGVAGSGEACLQDDVLATSVSDAATPAAGEGFWYLVRGVNCAGSGTLDGWGAGQAGVRDGGGVCGP